MTRAQQYAFWFCVGLVLSSAAIGAQSGLLLYFSGFLVGGSMVAFDREVKEKKRAEK